VSTRTPVSNESGPISDRVWTVPNILTFARLLAVPVFLWLVLAHEDGWALGVLAAAGVTDYLDGRIARQFDLVTRLGQALDPVADRLYILCALIGLCVRGIVPWWFMVLLVLRDLVGTAVVGSARRMGYRGLPVSFVGKAATFCLLYAFPLLMVGDWADRWGTPALVLGWAFAWWGLALYWLGVGLYIRQARQLSALIRLETS
jgi:cardiolipin synthase (CMP-forming)